MSDKWKVLLGRSWQWGLSLLFAAAVFLFWAVPYYSVMSYQEQLQMFLWDGDYFWERVSLPGGLSDWLGEFLVISGSGSVCRADCLTGWASFSCSSISHPWWELPFWPCSS